MKFSRHCLGNLVPAKHCNNVQWNDTPIRTWREFHKRVWDSRTDLLRELSRFQSPVLVAGCQRSGTTLLSRIISRSADMASFSFSKDDELDGALILAGLATVREEGRFCFQTTYLDDHYPEYYEHAGRIKLLWLVRNPFSVIYSMLYNWRPRIKSILRNWPPQYALNSLFLHCGMEAAPPEARMKSRRIWPFGLTPLERAAYAYAGKSSQIFELREKLCDDDLMILEYDTLVLDKDSLLPAIYDWVELPYERDYAGGISGKALKKADKLSAKDKKFIEQTCLPIYEKAAALVSRV